MAHHRSLLPILRRWVWHFSVAAVSAWLAYKLAHRQRIRRGGKTGSLRHDLARSSADMSRFTPGASAIPCRAWDFGRGLAGYAWHAPRPRAVLLLQHGLGEHSARYVIQYNQLIPRLLHAGISVYAFDLWGHGRSPGGRGVTDIGRAVEDHLAARQMLRRQPLPVFVMGQSLGALVTAASVARDPVGVRGAILSSPVLYLDSTPLARRLATVVATIVPTLRIVAIDRTGLTQIPRESDAAAHDPMMFHGRIPMLLAATAAAAAHHCQKRYPHWRTPTLILHGAADRVTAPQESIRFHQTIESPDKTLHLVEGGYHELLNDTDRDQSLQTILTWLHQRT